MLCLLGPEDQDLEHQDLPHTLVGWAMCSELLVRLLNTRCGCPDASLAPCAFPGKHSSKRMTGRSNLRRKDCNAPSVRAHHGPRTNLTWNGHLWSGWKSANPKFHFRSGYTKWYIVIQHHHVTPALIIQTRSTSFPGKASHARSPSNPSIPHALHLSTLVALMKGLLHELKWTSTNLTSDSNTPNLATSNTMALDAFLLNISQPVTHDGKMPVTRPASCCSEANPKWVPLPDSSANHPPGLDKWFQCGKIMDNVLSLTNSLCGLWKSKSGGTFLWLKGGSHHPQY